MVSSVTVNDIILPIYFLSALALSYSEGKSLEDLYKNLQLKMFDFRQKDFISKEPKKAPQAPAHPPPKPGFGALVRGKDVPVQPLISVARDPTVLQKPNTVSNILNRLRAQRL